MAITKSSWRYDKTTGRYISGAPGGGYMEYQEGVGWVKISGGGGTSGRVSEVVKLKQEDIDYGRRLLFIKEAKGGKDRYVPFPKQFTRSLKQVPIGCGIRSLQRAFKRALLKTNITKDAHFHTLRHSAATHYLNQGMNILEVQRLLGHENISTTTIYLHVSPDKVKESMDNIWK